MILLSLLSTNSGNPLYVLTRLSDQTLHQISLWSIVLGVIGFLYFSSDLLANRNGILRSMLQVIFPMLICGLPFLLIAFIARYIPGSSLWVLPVALVCAVLAGGAGFFHSLFPTGPSHDAQQARQEQQAQQKEIHFVLKTLSAQRGGAGICSWRVGHRFLLAFRDLLPLSNGGFPGCRVV